MESIQAIGNSYAIFHTAIGGKFSFKCLYFLAEHIPTGLHYPPIGGVEDFLQLSIRSLQIQERHNSHGFPLTAPINDS